jgi:predicted acylesterase/phospholipase RssA
LTTIDDVADFLDDELDTLMSASVFDGLQADDWDILRPLIERGKHQAGDVLVRGGDDATGLRVILSGRCQVFLKERLIAEGPPGTAFGEYSLLAEGRAALTVQVVRDSVVAHLPRDAFDRVAEQVPRLLRAVGRLAAQRAIRSPSPPPVVPSVSNIAVLCFDERAHAGTFAQNLKAAMTGGAVSEVVDQAFVDDNADQHGPTHMLSKLDLQFDVTFTVPDPADSEWTRRCLRQADRVVLVAMGDSTPRVSAAERHVLELIEGDACPVYLVLLHPPDTTAAKGTLDWLQRRELAGHLHVRLGDQRDYGRAGRMLTNRAVGLVLGGASTRGIAHLGVANALTKNKIPVDVVVGSSSGALMAGLLALQRPHDETVAMAIEGLSGVAPRLSTMGPPLVAMASGQVPVESGKRTWGDLCLEDMFLTCIFTATDLARSALVHLDRGPVWKAVRAATSLPVIWPPVIDGERVLIDGGVLDNIPVASIARYCPLGLIFAADFNPSRGDSVLPVFADLEPYGEVLSGWTVAWNKYAPGTPQRRYPALRDTLTYTMLLASIRHAADLEANPPANLELLRISLPDEGFFAVDAAAGKRLVDHAQSAALPTVKQAWQEYRAGRRQP